MFEATEFEARRRAVIDAMAPDDVLVCFGAREKIRNRDVHYPFRQHSDFQYLCGFAEPDALLVLAPQRAVGEFIAFVRPKDADRERWDGFRHGTTGVRDAYGADEAFTLADIDEQLPALLKGRRRIWFALGDNPENDRRIIDALNQLRSASRAGVIVPTEFVDIGRLLHEQRLHKRPAELDAMREAAAVSASAHCRAMRATQPGRYEYEIEAELQYEFAKHGMQPAYGSIVAGGSNACVLHYVTNRDQLHDGDLLLVDAAAENACYASDITRTWPVNGRYSAAQRDVYDVVLAAQQQAIDAATVGNHWNSPHDAAVRCLTQGMTDLGLLKGNIEQLVESGAYRRYYMHNTGHWLGMDVHDVGDYKHGDDWRHLEAGMVLTVEPGLYIASDDEQAPSALRGIGIRIEDDICITDGQPDVLTAGVPKDADEIESLMAS